MIRARHGGIPIIDFMISARRRTEDGDEARMNQGQGTNPIHLCDTGRKFGDFLHPFQTADDLPTHGAERNLVDVFVNGIPIACFFPFSFGTSQLARPSLSCPFLDAFRATTQHGIMHHDPTMQRYPLAFVTPEAKRSSRMRWMSPWRSGDSKLTSSTSDCLCVRGEARRERSRGLRS